MVYFRYFAVVSDMILFFSVLNSVFFLVAHFTRAQMGVCWSQYVMVRSCLRLVGPLQTVASGTPHIPLLPFEPSTQLEFCGFVSVGFSNLDVCDQFKKTPRQSV